jgi:hypothetical protein
MKRLLLLATLLTALLVAAGSASAHVHGISAAECAAPGAPSGATSDGSRAAIEQGRPGPPIPVTASDGRTQSRGGEAPAQGENC